MEIRGIESKQMHLFVLVFIFKDVYLNMNIGEEDKPMERERIKLWEKMVFKGW